MNSTSCGTTICIVSFSVWSTYPPGNDHISPANKALLKTMFLFPKVGICYFPGGYFFEDLSLNFRLTDCLFIPPFQEKTHEKNKTRSYIWCIPRTQLTRILRVKDVPFLWGRKSSKTRVIGIHGTGIFTYTFGWFWWDQLLGNYTNPMDPSWVMYTQPTGRGIHRVFFRFCSFRKSRPRRNMPSDIVRHLNSTSRGTTFQRCCDELNDSNLGFWKNPWQPKIWW